MVIKNSQIVDEKFKMISYLALFTYQRTAPFFMLSLDSIELLRGTPLLVVDHGCCYGDDGTWCALRVLGLEGEHHESCEHIEPNKCYEEGGKNVQTSNDRRFELKVVRESRTAVRH